MTKEKENFIHHSRLCNIMEEGKEVSLKYVEKSTGKIIEFSKWICTSWHSDGNTVNIKNPLNNEYRKLIRQLIIEINGVEIIM